MAGRRCHLWEALTALWAGAGGTALAEVVVAVGISTLAVGMVGQAIFHALSLQRTWQGQTEATRQMRQAFGWFAQDALNAHSLTLVNGAPPAQSVTLTWTDRTGTLHAVTYSLSGGTLVREAGGVQTVLASQVTGGGFSLSGKVLTFSLRVRTPHGDEREGTLQTYLRGLR
ncbi:hypothetical protein HRbin23_01185 [bacterium HR23]|nr:hypothetical protein HRbin23_01185 [bacterium HR23]